jgi:hypothetical protein
MIVGHKPLTDPVIQQEIFNFLQVINSNNVCLENYSSESYFEAFENWITQSHKNTLQGFTNFKHKAYCVGTYDGIQAFIHRHATSRRIRFSRAEFVGSKIVSNSAGANWCYLEDAQLDANDALVLSLPFSGNGDYYPNHIEVLNKCSKLSIPVLLDLAYFGISSGIEFDLGFDCITDVVFSLSKPMSTQLRLGLRLTKEYQDDVVQVLSDSKTYNRISTSIGTNLLQKFSHNWIIDKYLPKQKKICSEFNIKPTPTVTLALGDYQNYNAFFREGYYRICLTDELLKDI